MGELFRMWGNTRMVVLTAISAALYAAILIPFKIVPLIPGITEFRPANAVPVVCSFLFGPAAAWGAAFGNLIGDFFGGLGPGDVFGFLGNLFYGFVPYAVWGAVSDAGPVRPPPGRCARRFATAGIVLIGVGALGAPALLGVSAWQAFGGGVVASAAVVALVLAPALLVLVITLAATLCATFVGWGLHLLGFHPFNVLATIVLMNNLVVAIVLAPALLAVLYPRLERAHLLARDVLGPRPRPPAWRAALGIGLAVAGTAAAFIGGQLIAGGSWLPWWVPYHTASGALEIGLGLLPLLAIAVLGLALL